MENISDKDEQKELYFNDLFCKNTLPSIYFRVRRFLSRKNAIHHFHLSKKNLHLTTFGFFPYDVTLAQARTPWLLT